MFGKLGLKKKGDTPPASEAAQGGFDQQAAKRERAAQLAKVMFAHLDQDRDGVLLCHEVQVSFLEIHQLTACRDQCTTLACCNLALRNRPALCFCESQYAHVCVRRSWQGRLAVF